MIKNIRLFTNNEDKSIEIARLVREKFIENQFNISESDFDLGVAIGGDGTFLKMIIDSRYSSNPYYVGVNAGTLGFMQEVKPTEIDSLVAMIKNNNFKVENIGIQETDIYYDGIGRHYYSLNEIVIRDKNLRALKTNIYINNKLFENFAGDGILVSTELGSTSQNLSYGGCVVFNDYSSLVLTPLGPINNACYRTLRNSMVIPNNMEIKLVPSTQYNNYLVTIDGNNNIFDKVDYITTGINNKKIKMIRYNHYNLPEKLREKLLS